MGYWIDTGEAISETEIIKNIIDNLNYLDKSDPAYYEQVELLIDIVRC